MIIGVGIVLLALGLILVTGAVDLPASWASHIASDTLGWILIAVGGLSILLGLAVTVQRNRAATTRIERDHATPVDTAHRGGPDEPGITDPSHRA